MGKSYLVEGARLKCLCGSKAGSLKVTDHGYYADGRKKANCKDCLPNVNIPDFGMCKMNKGGKVCKGFMKLADKWDNLGDSSSLEKLSGHTALTMDSVLLCKKGGLIVPETSGQGEVREINWGLFFARYGVKLVLSALGVKGGCLYGRDPVNLNTGNFLYEKEDLVIRGKTRLSFHIYYNSMDKSCDGSMGRGWNHSYAIFVKWKEDGTVCLHLGDGRKVFFRKGVGSVYVPIYGGGLLKAEDSGYRYASAGETEYFFDGEGRLVSKKDGEGKETLFMYNSNGKLAEVRGTGGESLHYYYNMEGNLYKIHDHTGREVRLFYSYHVLQGFVNSSGQRYTYGYNEDLCMESVTTPRGIVSIRNTYDGVGRVVKQVTANGGTVEFCYDDGGMRTYEKDQNGNIISHESDNRFRNVRTVYSDSEELFQYNDDDRLTLYTDRNGNRTAYSYDYEGNLSGITDALGRQTSFTRDRKGRLMFVSIGGKVVRKNVYDGKGRLVKTMDALGRTRETIYGENGLPEQIIQPDGSRILFSHDERGNIRCITDPYGCTVRYEYDALNRVIKTTDGEGNCISYQYDEGNRLVSVMNKEGATRNYTYNVSGKPVRVEDFDGRSIGIEYNAMGKPGEFTDKEGNRTRAEYDLAGNLAETVSPTGLVTVCSYDSDNRLVRAEAAALDSGSDTAVVLEYEYDPAGNLLHESAGDKKETLWEVFYEYDAMNRVIAVTEPLRGRTSYEYDSVTGRICCITDVLGNRRTFHYNEAGELVKETDIHGNTTHYAYNLLGQATSITDGAGRVTNYRYLTGGRRDRIVYPDGRQIIYEYDGMGRVSRETDGQGYSLSYAYDAMGRVQCVTGSTGQKKSYAYDIMGNVTAITDANGNTTRYAYTPNGKLYMVTDALDNRTEYVYDAADRLVSICQHGKKDEADRTAEYVRDAFGRVTCIRDALGGEEFYRYDALGHVTEKKDRDGLVTSCTYTAGGKPESILYGDGCRAEFTYTPLGQLAVVRDWLGETRFERDRQGRISEITDHEGRTVCYEWGSMGERRGMTYPDGTIVSFQYDSLLRPAEFIRSAKGREALWVRYRYDGLGRLIGKENSGGYRTEWDYNGLGQLECLVHQNDAGILDRYRYGYDAMGNRTSIEKDRRGLSEESGRYRYVYDALQRLTDVEKDGEMLRSYHYDSFGNRTGMEDYGKGMRNVFVYDALNRMQEEWKWENVDADWEREMESMTDGFFPDDSHIHKTYTYDGRGNLTGEYRNGSLLHGYRFNAMNRLAEAWDGEGRQTEYSYSALGQRTGKNGSGGEESYLLDLTRQYHNLLWREKESEKQNFYWDYGIVAMDETGGGQRYYLPDELGSPLRVLYRNGKGDVYGYNEFGMDVHETEGWGRTDRCYGRQGESQPFGYTGYRYDDVSGTYFAQAREYEAGIGRFIAEDVMRGVRIIPKTLNRYTYCWENPINFLDWTGMDGYYFFDPQMFEEGENPPDVDVIVQKDVEFLEKEYNTEIHLVPMDPESNPEYTTFQDAWNNMEDEVDVVVILTHSNDSWFVTDSVIDSSGKRKTVDKVMRNDIIGLDKKKIGTMFLFGCNMGLTNPREGKNSLASTFYAAENRQDIGMIIACDGSIMHSSSDGEGKRVLYAITTDEYHNNGSFDGFKKYYWEDGKLKIEKIEDMRLYMGNISSKGYEGIVCEGTGKGKKDYGKKDYGKKK